MANILMRVNAGGNVGLGHFYRSKTLAKCLKRKGHKVFFVHNTSDFWKAITDFDLDKFEVDEKDLNALVRLIERLHIDKYYVDSFVNHDTHYISALKKKNVRVYYYQNLTENRHLCDVFILPSIHQNEAFFDKFNEDTKVFQGLEYFTFNEEISKIPLKENAQRKVKNIGITSGGSDPENVLLNIYNKLLGYETDYHYNFYYGINYMHTDEMESLKDIEGFNFSPYNVKEIMGNDLLISAFGVSTYEFMALNMPMIGVGHQDSNALAANFLAKATGGIVSLGHITEALSGDTIIDTIHRISNNKEFREQLCLNANHVIDLNGVDRVLKIIENE